MDERLIQRSRYVLRSRVRRVQTVPSAMFVQACQQLIEWLSNHPVLSAGIRHLDSIEGDFREVIPKIVKDASLSEGAYDPGFYDAKNSVEHAAVCLSIVRAIALVREKAPGKHEFIIRCLGEYFTQDPHINYEDAIETLRDVAIDGLYEFLDERIDARNVLYAILVKYKQRSEWFHRSRLRQIASEGLEGKIGERALAVDLHEYVLDQGVEFIVEPLTASGEPDLLLRDSDGRYIIIDAKYIPSDAARSLIREKMASGFNQVSRYCDDFNEPEGFLVSFVCTDKKIRLELEEADGMRFLTIGGKKVYYMPLSIAELPSASKAGKARGVRISATELLEVLDS